MTKQIHLAAHVPGVNNTTVRSDPRSGEHTIARGRASMRMHRDPLAVAAQWRAKAEAEKLSIRELPPGAGSARRSQPNSIVVR